MVQKDAKDVITDSCEHGGGAELSELFLTIFCKDRQWDLAFRNTLNGMINANPALRSRLHQAFWLMT